MFASPIIECIPNFSEGRDPKIIQAVVLAIQAVPKVKVLHIDSGYSANRTVVTFVGPPQAVIDAAFAGIHRASQLIDMSKQEGTHPRIGATDVCPLVPVANITVKELLVYAETLAKKVGTELDIPVYLYEHAAIKPNRKNLATIRSGEYEGLKDKLCKENWQPDYGPNQFNAQAGATVIGVRNFLVAYNVNLNTRSVTLANEIAKTIRTSGYTKTLPGNKKIRIPGQLPALKAIGWYIDEFGFAQVSMNLVDIQKTGIHQAFESCKEVAESLGVKVLGSELIGLIPLAAVLTAGNFYKRELDPENKFDSSLVNLASERLGLNHIRPFDPMDQILELKMISYGFDLKY